MDINVQQQLKDLKGEIDAVNADIKAKEEKWENATADGNKAFYAQSIQRLDDEKKTLIDNRKQLSEGGLASSSQGKDISMAVSPAKLCSRYMRTVAIRLVCSNVTALPSPSPSTCIGVLENDYDDNGGVYHNITPSIRDSTSR